MGSNKDIRVGILTRHSDLTPPAEPRKSISVALEVFDQGEGMEEFLKECGKQDEMEDILKDAATSVKARKDYMKRVYRMLAETPPDSATFPAVFFTYQGADGLHLAHDKGMFLSEMPSMINLTTIAALRDFLSELTGKDVHASLGMVELPIMAAGNSDLIHDCRMAAEKRMLKMLTQ